MFVKVFSLLLVFVPLARSEECRGKNEECDAVNHRCCSTPFQQLGCVSDNTLSQQSKNICKTICSRSGDQCGGIAQMKCCNGEQLKCEYETPLHPEAVGTCQKTCNKEGGICGGFTFDPQVCCEGHRCLPQDIRIPDLPGKCHEIK